MGRHVADRIVESAIAQQVVESGLATVSDLQRIRAGWLCWSDEENGWFSILHGEILATV